MSSLKNFIKKKFSNLFGCSKISTFFCELDGIACFLVFLATVALFLYAMIFPHFWIIFILFLLFLALLALVS